MADPARGSVPPKIRRRNRMITSCLECRRRKLKCDKSHPCVNCKKTSRDCVFLAPALDSASQLKLTEVKEKMGMLEVSLEQEIARSARNTSAPNEPADLSRKTRVSIDPDEDSLEPTPTALADVVFDDDDPDNDFYDLGFTMGKLRLSDRVGGFFRPTMVQELGVLLSELKHEDTASLGTVFPRPANFIGPNEDFLPPSSDFFLSSGRTGMSLIHFLPAKPTADRLLQQYWYSVHPLCRLVHRPSFEHHYATFWEDIGVGVEPVASLQALVFAVLFSAAVSVDKETCIDTYGTAKVDLIKNLQQATEMALGRAKFLRSTRLQTLQAFVMYLTPMCRDQISRAHCALVASAIRLAENMSLHRDGARYGLKPVETHVRRLIWWQVVFLDHRCCELRGPRLIIREDDFDTRLPLNKNDENLTDAATSTSAEPGAVDRWTDMVPTLLKIECLEVNRSIWFDRPRIDKKQKSLTEVMIGIENSRRRIYAKYMGLFGEGHPIQQLTKTMVELHLSKWHIAVLHRFHHNVTMQMPSRLRQIMINSARTQLEVGVTMSSSPVFKPWAWYNGAQFSWQVGFLLLVDFYASADWEQPERTWRSLDFVFESPPTPMPFITKARLVMLEIWDRMRIYREDRKIRPPTDALKAIKLSAESRNNPAIVAAIATQRSRQAHDGSVEMAHQARSERAASSTTPPSLLQASSPDSLDGKASHISATGADAGAMVEHFGYLGTGIDFGAAPTMTSPGSSAPGDFEMPDIDWNEWDKLFPSVNYDQLDPTAGVAAGGLGNFGYVVSR